MVQSTGQAASAPNGSGNLIIGGSNGGGDNYRGMVDDIAVWNQALQANRLQQLLVVKAQSIYYRSTKTVMELLTKQKLHSLAIQQT